MNNNEHLVAESPLAGEGIASPHSGGVGTNAGLVYAGQNKGYVSFVEAARIRHSPFLLSLEDRKARDYLWGVKNE